MKSFALRSGTAPLFLTGAIAATFVFAAAGCGSGNGSAPVPGFSGGLVGSGYVGRTYTGQVSLANGQVGNLSASVSGTTASGTLQIVDPTRKATAKTRLVIATPFLSGTFDPATGAINLSGSYVDANGQTIPISITGTLPTPPSTTGGSLTVTINGQSYTSTFGGGTPTNPTPSPSASASPSPSTSPTPNPTPSATPAAGVINQITITPAAGSGANNASTQLQGITAESGIFQVTATVKNSIVSVFLSSTNRTADPGADELQVSCRYDGAMKPFTFDLPSENASSLPFADALYREKSGNAWQVGGFGGTPFEGQIIVEQVDATKVRVRLINVRVDPSPSSKNTTGVLRLNGTIETTKPPIFLN